MHFNFLSNSAEVPLFTKYSAVNQEVTGITIVAPLRSEGPFFAAFFYVILGDRSQHEGED
jgi:hypothetical protein